MKALKGYRTYLSIAAAFVVQANDFAGAIDLDHGLEVALTSGLLALAAFFRSRAKK